MAKEKSRNMVLVDVLFYKHFQIITILFYCLFRLKYPKLKIISRRKRRIRQQKSI